MGDEYPNIRKKIIRILDARDDSGTLIRSINYKDGSVREQYSYSDIANLLEKLEEMEAREQLRKNASSIFKPIRMAHA